MAGLAATGTVGYYAARGVSGPASSSAATTTASSTSSQLQAAAAGSNAADYGFSGYCGVERHDVKDLTDGFAPGAAQDSSVSALRALPVPSGAAAGRTPPEQDVYRIEAIATAFKIEADSDVHLAIVDPSNTNATMIAEFPAASCLAQSTAAPQIEAARTDMINALGDPPTGGSYTNLNPPRCVTITGVAFFDRIHGQRGVAPNGIELHPVLAFETGCGNPAPPPTTPTTVAATTPEPPDTTPITTVSLPTVPTPTVPIVTTPSPQEAGAGCDLYPGHHWFRHRYHASCRSNYFTSP